MVESKTKGAQPFDVICVYNITLQSVDKEQPEKNLSFTEIVEISVIQVDCKKFDYIDEFHTYVKPVLEPVLTKHCIKQSGITQKQVNQSVELEEALQNLDSWLDKSGLSEKNLDSFAMASLNDFTGHQLHREASRKGISLKPYFSRWINLKDEFPQQLIPKSWKGRSGFYKIRNLRDMLDAMEMKPQGKLYQGIGEVRNLANVLCEVLYEGFDYDSKMFKFPQKQQERPKTTSTISNAAKTQKANEKKEEQKQGIEINAWSQAFGQGGGWGNVNLGALVPEKKEPEKVENENAETKEESKETQENTQSDQKPSQSQNDPKNSTDNKKTQLKSSQKGQKNQKQAEKSQAQQKKVPSKPEDSKDIKEAKEDKSNPAAEDKKEEQKEEQKAEPEKPKVDMTKVFANWGGLSLEPAVETTKVIAKTVEPSQNIRIKNDVRLFITEKIDFSMTQFDKVNKGFSNTARINCFMNVILQSLFACPAMFNLMIRLAESEGETSSSESKTPNLTSLPMLSKIVHLAKHFDPKFLLDKPFNCKTVNAEKVFSDFLREYNPDNEQQDASDFFNLILDRCHEEMKEFYYNPKQQTAQSYAQNGTKDSAESWNLVGELKRLSSQSNMDEICEPSIIRDIVGGVFQQDIQIEGHQALKTRFEPFYGINLAIPRNARTVEECLDAFFQEKPLYDYSHNGKRVNASQKYLISRLPNVLCLNFKRFIYTDRLIKMRDHIDFDEILEVQDQYLTSSQRANMSLADRGIAARYRLFSVVQHIGDYAHRGHYTCFAMDSEDRWAEFNDHVVIPKNFEAIQYQAQAYLLFYELIQ